ncbi:MAG: hypothetical protein LDL41_03070 [Coleofasciculus sp. S288]|nr:hypothetical protein [Coleofasciculus sp. S288]
MFALTYSGSQLDGIHLVLGARSQKPGDLYSNSRLTGVHLYSQVVGAGFTEISASHGSIG